MLLLLPLLPAAMLLMAAAAAAAGDAPPPPSFARLNPWLSACDLVQGGELGECERPPRPGRPATTTAATSADGCPAPCPAANDTTTDTATQCLHYLLPAHKRQLCDAGRGGGAAAGDVFAALRRLRLRHCCEHAAAAALPPQRLRDVQSGGPACHGILQALLDADDMAARVSCHFATVLSRYDCAQTYSLVYQCHDCKVTNTIHPSHLMFF